MSKLSQYDSAIRALVPINRLPKTRQKNVLDACVLKEFARDSFIYQQGDDDDYLYYLLAGAVSLYWRDEKLKQIQSGSVASKRAFDRPGKKRHSIKAETSVTIAVFPSFLVEREMRAARLVSEKSNLEVSDIAAETSSNWMIRMLQSDLFSQLAATNIQNIFARMQKYVVKADQKVVRQGGRGDYYYVIEQGYCEVTRQIPGGKREIYLADLKPGDSFGEEALIADGVRGATVTMLVDGVLMRLPKTEFKELIQTPLLKPVSVPEAINAVKQQARWIDIRYPEQFALSPMTSSENIPFNMIRLKAGRLDSECEYIVCSNSAAQSAVAAFLLLERGVAVRYLDASVDEMYEGLPSELQAEIAPSEKSTNFDAQSTREYGEDKAGFDSNELLDQQSDTSIEDGPGHLSSESLATVSGQAESRSIAEKQIGRGIKVSSDEAVQRLENTIDRIDRVYVERERELESQPKVDPDAYARTATGQRLADLIDDMERSQRLINNGTTGAEDELPTQSTSVDMDVTGGQDRVEHLSETSNPNILLVDTNVPLPVDVDLINDDVADLNLSDDVLSMMIRDFEKRVRNQLGTEVKRRTQKIEARYQQKISKIHRAAAIEVKKRQAAYRQKAELHYKKKELSLRKHYQKLMALANKVTAQKAQLEDAKRQFEDKLQAANALYNEVEDMRASLKEHLANEMGMHTEQRRDFDDVSS